MNEKVYLKFKAPKGEPSSRSGRIKEAIENGIGKILSSIIPKANPDFEHLIDYVDIWAIEYDKKENATCREIGFDKNGSLLVAMPKGENYGFWTDSQLTIEDYENFNPTTIPAAEFENYWSEFKKKTKK